MQGSSSHSGRCFIKLRGGKKKQVFMNTLDPYIGLNERYELDELFLYVFLERTLNKYTCSIDLFF
jgi:uncharacterized FlgJ-related protein